MFPPAQCNKMWEVVSSSSLQSLHIGSSFAHSATEDNDRLSSASFLVLSFRASAILIRSLSLSINFELL